MPAAAAALRTLLSNAAAGAAAAAAAPTTASKGAGKGGGKGSSAGPGHGAGGAGGAQPSGQQPCKFFGSAKGCSSEKCPFSHEEPNSVQPCSFKQRNGHCDRGDACTYRHVPWTSAEHARVHYASRETSSVEVSQQRYKQLHRDEGGEPERLAKEHVEGVIEREMYVEAYGSTAIRMMEKMGYTAGSGLGKEKQGNTRLVGPCLALERAAQSCVLGLGQYCGNARATAAERAARLADARAQKRLKVEETAFVQHNLLSSDESSEGEDSHVKARDTMLSTA